MGIQALLDTQVLSVTGSTGDVMTVQADGSYLAETPVGASPGGSSGQIQYNNAGAFGGTVAVVYAGSGSHLSVTAQAATDVPVTVKGAVSQSANLTEWKNSSSAIIGQVTAIGAVQFGIEAGNDMIAIGPADASLKDASNNSYHTARGISGGSSWRLLSQRATVALLSSGSMKMAVPIDFDASAVIKCTGVDLPITLNGYSGGGQARVSNGVEINGGAGGTGGTGNFRGGNIAIRAGKTAGNATPATVTFQVSPAGSSGGGIQPWQDALQLDGTTTAGDTAMLLYDVDAGSLVRVSVGAADSGGTGYKILRVPN